MYSHYLVNIVFNHLASWRASKEPREQSNGTPLNSRTMVFSLVLRTMYSTLRCIAGEISPELALQIHPTAVADKLGTPRTTFTTSLFCCIFNFFRESCLWLLALCSFLTSITIDFHCELQAARFYSRNSSGRDTDKPLHLPHVLSDMTLSSSSNKDLNLIFCNLRVPSASIAGVVPWHIRRQGSEDLIPICPPLKYG